MKILKGKEYDYCGIRKLHHDMVHIGILAIIVAVGLLLLSMPVSAVDDCAGGCHAGYSPAVLSTKHNQSLNPSAPVCTDCHIDYVASFGHTTGNKGYIVNESNTCRNCHIDGVNGFYERHTSSSDCTQCHFANTTQPFSMNASLYAHDHNLVVEHSYYEYNTGGGMPLAINGGTGVGMFPQYTCSLTCHATRSREKVDLASSTWLNSAHADSRFGTSDSKNNCAKCKSPNNYDDTLTTNPVIAEEDWQGIQCRVCHNLHDRRFPFHNGTSGAPIAFYNATASSYVEYSVYDEISNNTELCEKCHQPYGGSHDSKFAGTHKDLGFTCTSCHMNSSFSRGMHEFKVEDLTSGMTGCEVCHEPEDHTFASTALHDDKVECVACHDQTFTTVNATGYAVSDDGSFGLWDTTGEWSTYMMSHGSPKDWPLHNISRSVDCDKCHGAISVFNGTIAPEFASSTPGNYVGNSSKCGACHTAAFAEWSNTTHTSKLIPKDDAVERGLPSPPSGYNWDNVSYVIGAKWKIRYVNDTGYIITDGGMNQYNIATQEWVDYHKDETRDYNCGHCHNTGYLGNMSDETREPWKTLRSQGQYPAGVYDNSLAPGFAGYWAENSIGCEACHGPGGDHINAPSKLNIVNADMVSNSPEICGDCHVRQSGTHLIKVGEIDLIATLNDSSPSPLSGIIDGQHHEQWEDWYDSDHRNAGVDCVKCHGGHSVSDPAYADGPTGKTKFINGTVFPAAVVQDCVDCHVTPKHSYYNDNAECISCHMPKVRKSAVAYDIRSHWFDPNAITGKDGSSHAASFGDLQNLTESCITCHTSSNLSEQINVTFGMHEDINTTEGTGLLNSSDCKTCHYGATDKILTYLCEDCHTSEGTAPDKSSILITGNMGVATCVDCHVADGTYHQGDPRGAVANPAYVNRDTSGSTMVTDCVDCHSASNLDDAPFHAPGGGSHIDAACETGGCHAAGTTTMAETVHNVNSQNWGTPPTPSITMPVLDAGTVTKGTDVTVTATVSAEGGRQAVDGAQYRIMAGATEIVPWTAMSAVDGDFEGTSENVSAVISTSALSGTYNVDVRGMAGGPAQNPLERYYPMNGDVSLPQNVTLEVTIPVVTYDVDISVDSSSKSGAEGEDITYVITVTNTGNLDDIFDLSIDNVDGAETATLDDTSLAVLASQSNTTVLHVSDPVMGSYTVNVTATSVSDSGTTNTVSTISNIGISPDSASAVRDIENQIIAPGGSTNVTVTITSNINQALVLQEIIPVGWTFTLISDDSSAFKSSTNEWVWFSVSPGATKIVKYGVTMPSDAPGGTYYINGSIANSNGMIAIVSGENSISSDLLSYYRGLGDDPNKVETSDLLQASEDWRRGVILPGFNVSITTQQLLMLSDEWALG